MQITQNIVNFYLKRTRRNGPKITMLTIKDAHHNIIYNTKMEKKNKIFRSLVNVQINYHISVGKADIWAFCYFFTTLLKMVLKNIE